MAYNKGLSQQDKDRINKQVKELAAQGKSKQEILAWRDAQVEAARAATAEGKPSPLAVEAAAGGDSISDAGSSEFQPQTWEEFAQTAGVKKPRVDDDGEVINLAEDFGQLGEIVESIPFIGDLIDDIYGAAKTGWAQGQTVDDALALFAEGADADPEQIAKYIEAVNKMQNQPVSQEMKDFNETYEAAGGGTWGFIKAIAQNPSIAATTSVSSIIAMINPASAAGGALGAGAGFGAGLAVGGVGAIPGAIGGAFAGAGGILETGVSFTEFLQEQIKEKGLEFDEEGIAAVLSDPEALSTIRAKSALRGGIIAVVDGLTAGVASKAAKGVANTAKTAAKLKGVLTATAIEGAGGGLGEAGARLAVGQELDAREIGLEIVGEFGTGATIGKAAVETQPAYTINDQKVSRNDINAALKTTPDAGAKIKVKNDPELQAQVNESITRNKQVNENLGLLTADEKEARDAKVKEISAAINERDKFEKGTQEWNSLNELVKEARVEATEEFKQQNAQYNTATKEQIDIIANTQAQIDNNNKTISQLSKPIKLGAVISSAKKNLITKLQSKNEQLQADNDAVRGQIKQQHEVNQARAQQRAATQEAAQPVVEEEVSPEEQEAIAQEEAIAADQAAVQEQINAEVDEEATDNGQKLEKLKDSMLELGIDIVSPETAVPQDKGVNFIPLSKDGDSFNGADFEREIKFDPDIPLEKVDAKKAVKEIQDTAKQLGADANVEVVRVGEGWGVQGNITAGKRPESLAVKYAKQAEAAPTESAPVEEVDPIQKELDAAAEAVVGAPEERTADDYIADVAKKNKAPITPGDVPGEYKTTTLRNAYNVVRGLDKRGHKEAYFREEDDGSITIVPGEKTQDTGIGYSVDDQGRVRDKEGKFAKKEKAEEAEFSISEKSSPRELRRQFYNDQDRYLSALENLPKEKARQLDEEFGDIFWDKPLVGTAENTWYKDVPADIQAEESEALNKRLDEFEGKKPKKDERRSKANKIWNWYYGGGLTNRFGIPAGFAALDTSFTQNTSTNTARKVVNQGILDEGLLSDGLRRKLISQYNNNGKLDKSDLSEAIQEIHDLVGNTEGIANIEFNLAEVPQDQSPSQPKNFRRHKDLSKAKGSRAQLNIGLENNPYTYEGIIAQLAKNPKVSLGTTEQVDGEYNGAPERTLVADIKYNGSAQDFRSYIESLNKNLTQEAIGAKFNDKGALIYDTDYTGERYTFDPQYFLEPSQQDHVTEDIEAARRKEIPANIPGGRKPAGISPRELGQEAGERARIQEAIQKSPDEKLEPGIQLAKDVKEREPGTEDVSDIQTFDKTKVEGPTGQTLRDQLKDEPRVDEQFLEDYNDNKIDDNQLIKSITPFILSQQPNKDLQGFALDKFTQQVKDGKLKNKSVKQVFGAAKQIARGAATLRNEELGQSRDYQRHRNVTRRAEQAFYAENGYEPGLQELADYINDNKNKYNLKKPITVEQVEDAKFDEIPEVELGGVQGDARDKAQTRAAKEAGFDQLTDVVLGDRIAAKVDQEVGRILDAAPEEVSRGRFTGQAPRRGAKYDVKGDPVAKKISKANTELDKDIRDGISDLVSASVLRDNYNQLKEILNLPQDSWDALSRSQKQDLKRKVVKGLATEAEQRLGKPTTPSQELEFSIEEGTATRVTDTGAKSGKQVNSHRQPWNQTAKELNNTIKNTNFDNDWVQWSPGQLGNIQRAKAKGIPDHIIRELNKQPARVAKLASRQGLRVRKDTRNPGVYHIYKPGKPGSPEYSVKESKVHTTRPTQDFVDSVVGALKKAWGDSRVYVKPSQWRAKVYGLQLSGSSMPFDRVKGLMHAGAVYLNPEQLTMDTPIHEFAHIWAKKLMRENPKLWKRGVELLKGSEYARAVYNVPAYKAYLKDNPSRFWEEVMANAIGKKGAHLFDSQTKAGKWDRWMDSIGKWLKQKLNISSAKNYQDLTLQDWLDVGVHGVFTGQIAKPSEKVEYSAVEDPDTNQDVAAAYLRGKKNRAKWYNPKSIIGRLIPPQADDYHGLVSRLKIPGIDKVTNAYKNNYNNYITAVTDTRKKIKDAQNKLGIPLDKADVTTVNGNKLTAAQAIQAHVDGFPNSFSEKPEVQEYIKTMKKLGLKPKKDSRYDLASPAQDTYTYLNNDLYQEHFDEFNTAKEEVFDPKMNEIVAEHGEKYAEALQKALQRMSTGKNNAGFTGKVTQKWNDWALGSVGTIMFLNFRSAALQLMSVGNYAFESKNPGAFLTSFLDPDTFAQAKKLWNDPYLKERRARAGFDVNAQEMMDMLNNSRSFGDFTKKVLNFGFKATSAVDSVAIALGGAAFMKANGGINAKNRAKWIESSEEAQQSARPDRVSQWQTESISKFILAFANTPQQYFRLSQKAFRSIQKGENVKQNLAKIGYYMAIQNMMFTAAQAASTALFGFGDSEDDQEERDQLNSMASTILRGMGLYGAVIDAGKNVIMEAIKQEGKANPDHVSSLLKATSITPPLNRKIQDLISIGRAHNYNADDKWVTTATRGIAATTNLPADWAHKKYDAAVALSSEQYSAFQKLLMLAGWSKWNFDKKDTGDEFGFGDADFGDVDFEDVDFGEVEF